MRGCSVLPQCHKRSNVTFTTHGVIKINRFHRLFKYKVSPYMDPSESEMFLTNIVKSVLFTWVPINRLANKTNQLRLVSICLKDCFFFLLVLHCSCDPRIEGLGSSPASRIYLIKK